LCCFIGLWSADPCLLILEGAHVLLSMNQCLTDSLMALSSLFIPMYVFYLLVVFYVLLYPFILIHYHFFTYYYYCRKVRDDRIGNWLWPTTSAALPALTSPLLRTSKDYSPILMILSSGQSPLTLPAQNTTFGIR
jgi:hypothetical protein